MEETIGEINFLERGILRFCLQKKVSKEKLTLKFKNADKEARERAIEHLAELNYLGQLRAINPNTGRPRTLYFITEAGRVFIEQFEHWLSEV